MADRTTPTQQCNHNGRSNRKRSLSFIFSFHAITALALPCCNTSSSLSFVSAFGVVKPLHVRPACTNGILHRQQHQNDYRTVKSKRIDMSIKSVSDSSENESSNVDDSKTVHVSITKTFPNKTPSEMKDAWISYQWQNGGGLPGIAVSFQKDDTNKHKRRMFPIGMEETITRDQQDGVIEYKVSDLGVLFSPFLKESSHHAAVTFTQSKDSNNATTTVMVWDVTFQVQNNQNPNLWKFITQNNIQTVVDNLASYTSTPRTYKRVTKLKNNTSSVVSSSIKDIAKQWIDFIWKGNGGLPPVVLSLSWEDEKNKSIKRLVIPPFLLESVTSVNCNDKEGRIEYKVVNLRYVTLPAHTHFGRVTFQKAVADDNNDDDIIDMIWEVEVRPYHNFESFVQIYTSTIITMLSRNFKSHVEEPNAMVSLKPPRGGGSGGENAKAFMDVPKSSWLGGVLYAHLGDSRSTWDQTVSLLQPWTWGRSVDVDEGEGEEWGRGFLKGTE